MSASRFSAAIRRLAVCALLAGLGFAAERAFADREFVTNFPGPPAPRVLYDATGSSGASLSTGTLYTQGYRGILLLANNAGSANNSITIYYKMVDGTARQMNNGTNISNNSWGMFDFGRGITGQASGFTIAGLNSFVYLFGEVPPAISATGAALSNSTWRIVVLVGQ